jgi:maltokinase
VNPQVQAAFAAGDLDFVAPDAFKEWLQAQRWFATKTREISTVTVRESIALGGEEPLVLAILEVRFPSGIHHLYQVPVALRAANGDRPDSIWTQDDWALYDALTDPVHSRHLGWLLGASASIDHEAGRLTFQTLAGTGLAKASEVKLIAGEQSNTALVFDEQVALKVFRRLQAGTNPELEMQRFLFERGFPFMPGLVGWYEHHGELLEATMGVASEYVANAADGWALVVRRLAEGEGEALLPLLADLGTATASMHTILGSDSSHADFAPEPCTAAAMSLIVAAIDSAVQDTFLDLPDDEALASVAGREQEVHDLVRAAGATEGGAMIRLHGDYHLGQVMLDGDRWVIVDFEGEPARSLAERRMKRPPLRDVAGMLRSFAYAVAAAERHHGAQVPEEWEQQARAAFLDAYRERVDDRLVPADAASFERMLAFFELEKSIYELRYELDHRPEWAPIPIISIGRLLSVIGT